MRLKTIGNKEVRLRPLENKDARRIARLANDRDIACNFSAIAHPFRLANARAYIQAAKAQYVLARPAGLSFGIEYRGDLCGAFNFLLIEYGKQVEVSYWLGREYRGQGIMPRALQLAIRFACRRLKAAELIAYTFTANESSESALVKSDFQYAGIAVRHAKRGGRYRDCKRWVRPCLCPVHRVDLKGVVGL